MNRAILQTVSVSATVSANSEKTLTASLPLQPRETPTVSALAHFHKKPKQSAGSSAWSGRIIFARDLEPIHTRLERSPTGPHLHIESETFGAILPASKFILELLAAKINATATA